MKKRTIVSMLCLMLVFFMSIPSVYAQDSNMLFTSTIMKSFTNDFAITSSSDAVKYTKGVYDNNRGNPYVFTVPVGQDICALSKSMSSVSANDTPVVAVNMNFLLQETVGNTHIYLNTKDGQSVSQTVSLMTMKGNTLIVGNTEISTANFKFGTWANGHYNLKLYYFASLGKVGAHIQKLKYASGTPVDKEWMFTGDTLKSSTIDAVGFKVECSAAATKSHCIQLFKTFSLTKEDETKVPESIINRVYTENLFIGNMANNLSNFASNANPETNKVSVDYNTWDATRGSSVKLGIPADTTYTITSNMSPVNTEDTPVVAADLTVLLTETSAEKQIILNTVDATSNAQSIPLLTITNGGTLKLGDVSFSPDNFKFGTWENGHYNLKLYYFASLGKVGAHIQKLKYASGTPVDKEWVFTADVPTCNTINNISLITTTTGEFHLFKFNLTGINEKIIPERISDLTAGKVYVFTSPEVTSDGVTYVASTNGYVTTSLGNTADLIIAAYDKYTNELLKVNVTTIEEAGEKEAYSSAITTEGGVDCKVRVFLWTADIKPIAAE